MLTTSLTSALAGLTDRELVGLRVAAEGAPNVVPGLLAYLEHLTDWERHRRHGLDFPLPEPGAAIDDTERDDALLALGMLAGTFTTSRHEPIARFLLAVVEVLGDSTPRAAY